jgi:hypothetical protein
MQTAKSVAVKVSSFVGVVNFLKLALKLTLYIVKIVRMRGQFDPAKPRLVESGLC